MVHPRPAKTRIRIRVTSTNNIIIIMIINFINVVWCGAIRDTDRADPATSDGNDHLITIWRRRLRRLFLLLLNQRKR